jgi:hypothetical protein
MCGTAGCEKAYGISTSNYNFFGKANPLMNGTLGQKKDSNNVSFKLRSESNREAPSTLKKKTSPACPCCLPISWEVIYQSPNG